MTNAGSKVDHEKAMKMADDLVRDHYEFERQTDYGGKVLSMPASVIVAQAYLVLAAGNAKENSREDTCPPRSNAQLVTETMGGTGEEPASLPPVGHAAQVMPEVDALYEAARAVAGGIEYHDGTKEGCSECQDIKKLQNAVANYASAISGDA